MAKLTLISAITLLVAADAMGAHAQSTDRNEGPDGRSVQAPPKSDPAGPKRGISEEGGMKASGPSQAKGGESR